MFSKQILKAIRNAKIKLYFIFLFYFFQSILFLEPWLGISGVSQVTVTLSHDHVLWWKIVEGSGKNDIILYIIYMVVLRQIHGHLG